MSTRPVRCPQCRAAASVPTAVVTARCPSCGHVFAAASALAPVEPAATDRPAAAKQKASGDGNVPLIAGVLGGIVVLAMAGIAAVTLLPGGGEPSEADIAAQTAADEASNEPVLVVLTDEELAALPIANVPDNMRKIIYDQIRDSARTTLEVPLLVPDGNPVRATLEKNQQAIHDNSMRQLSALHNISMDDIALITAEGDAKNWDPSPRSNARRNGKRLYPEERSRGWKGKGQ